MSIIYDLTRDLSGPIETVIAAGAAAFVAYRLGKAQVTVAETQAAVAERNWQIANERIVLELFERRIAIFEGIRDIIGKVLNSGRPTTETYFAYIKAIDKVPYYFGPEVTNYLELLGALISDLELDANVIADNLHPDRMAHIRGRTERMRELAKFHETSKILFGPYIQAHQKIGERLNF